MNQSKYLNTLRLINHSTIYRLFELNDYKIDDFMLKGAARIISSTCDLKVLDSTGLSLAKIGTYECYIKIYAKFVPPQKIINYEELNENFVKISLIEQRLHTSSSKVIYVEINKKML